VRRSNNPHKQVLLLSALKEDAIVAVLHVTDFVDHPELIFGIKLNVLLAVGHQIAHILHQVTES
jgi:hypothetical protein